MIIFLLLFFFLHDINTAGFAENTLLLTNCGHITFDEIDYDTRIQADEIFFQPILFIGKQSVEKIIQITVTDEIIVCHPKQLFWCVNKSDWICAKDLNIGDLLQTIDNQYIAIDNVQKIYQQTEIYSLSVGPPHHLYVGEQKILAHNVAWFVGVAATFAFEAGAIEFIKGSFVLAIGFIVLKIQDSFAKNKDKKKPKATFSAQPEKNGSGNFNPNDDDKKDKDKKKNLIYKGSEAHKSYQSGKKSAEPRDGQKALNNSYEFNKESGGRVGIEDDKFVILRWTRADEYHGYLITRDELLSQQTRYSDVLKTLIENKLIKY